MNQPCPPENRTMLPKSHERRAPLTKSELTEARAKEVDRKKWDPQYITAKEARSIPADILASDAQLRGRVDYSQQDWPENRMSATEALGDLPAGSGEDIEVREVDTESLFGGGRMADEE
jgi:hypothetical protein